MMRVLTGLAAWLGGTAAAVCLAWLGAGLVVKNTISVTGPVVPVISIAPTVRVTAPESIGPARPRPRPRPRPTASATAAPSGPAAAASSSGPAAVPSTSRSAAPSSAGAPRSYTLTGGQVTLMLTGDSARLVTAVPQAGFAVQTWSGPDWLRVDFSSGTQVSSLIASWNGHPPSVVVTN